ncbi:MAG: glycerol kinase GlpK [Clostridia bacterium]|nr:glycerol kinase GlpK [Clostridia bacterium]
MKYILALDQGTTSSRAIIYDKKGTIIATAQEEFTQYYPKPGWVEHDPMEIWETQKRVAVDALKKADLSYSDIDSIGITNQRETTIVWDRETGKPVYNAIVWQCRRTAEYCDLLTDAGYSELVRQKTGLKIDAYFSATKLRWILENIPGVRERAERGELLFGTIETWLIWNLTKGKVHITDYSNASRTMMFNVKELVWDKEILKILDIPEIMLPKAMPSSYIYGETDPEIFGGPVRIAGAAGDQQAALFGQTCFKEGEAKNTYGTGAFLLMNIGEKFALSNNGLVTTIAWGLNGKVNYALEGSVFVCGAAIQWLRDELDIIENAAQSEDFATRVEDTNGCYMVPAFVGLGAPYWDPYARGAIFGLTRGTNKYHLVRATLESMAYQVKDLIDSMNEDLKETRADIDETIGKKYNVKSLGLSSLKVDGGACRNNFLMQFQSDILNCPVKRPSCVETTSLGASYLAGLATGYYESTDDILKNWQVERTFVPEMKEWKRNELTSGWKKAVKRSMGWEKE